MDNSILMIIFSFVTGAVLAFILTRLNFTKANAILHARFEPLAAELDQLKRERDVLVKDKTDLLVKNGTIETRLQLLQTSYNEQKESMSRV